MTTQPEQQTTAPEVVLPQPDVPDYHGGGDWHSDEIITAYGDARAARAVEQERARVVAWLRDLGEYATRHAKAIERGEHA